MVSFSKKWRRLGHPKSSENHEFWNIFFNFDVDNVKFSGMVASIVRMSEN